jgi:hypothetical protein
MIQAATVKKRTALSDSAATERNKEKRHYRSAALGQERRDRRYHDERCDAGAARRSRRQRRRKQQAGNEQKHDTDNVAVEHERRNLGHLTVFDLHFLGRKLEDLHDVVVDEAHDRLMKHDLEQEIRRTEQETGESGFRQHARLVAAAQGVRCGNQECAGREPKHGNCLDKCCGPLGRPQGI